MGETEPLSVFTPLALSINSLHSYHLICTVDQKYPYNYLGLHISFMRKRKEFPKLKPETKCPYFPSPNLKKQVEF